MDTKYNEYLINKNLSDKTIKTYNENIYKFLKSNHKLNIESISIFIREYEKNHSANSTRLMLCSIRSYLKYLKLFDLERKCAEIKLPTIVWINRNIISIDEFNKINLADKKFFTRRNWIIFSILLFTGIRLSELKQIKFDNIDSEFIEIKGKGKKWRTIYIPNRLIDLLNENKDIIYKWNTVEKLSNNQIYKIIKSIGYKYFNKNISPHSLRRSYATNLINKNVNIKIISNLLGHSNIETTSRYLYISLQDIRNKLENVF